MALYRCDACGSPNVIKDSKAGGVGFNYAKGIAGTVILGAGGTVAGIESKAEEVFACPDCGVTLTHPMDKEMKNLVELGLRSAEARNNLTYCGAKMYWNFIRHRYKNLEEGIADSAIKAEDAERTKNNKEIIEKAKKTIKRVDEMLKSYHPKEDVTDLQLKWNEEMVPVFLEWENNYNALKKSCAGELEKELKKKYDEKTEEKAKQFQYIVNQENNLKARLSGLSFFKFSEKSRIRIEIEQLQKQKMEAQEEVMKYRSGSVKDPDFSEYKEEKERENRDLIRDYIAISPKPESPHEKRDRLNILKKMRDESLDMGSFVTNKHLLFYIYVVLDAMETDICYRGSYREDEKKAFCEILKEISGSNEDIKTTCLSICLKEEYADLFTERRARGLCIGINFDNYLLY